MSSITRIRFTGGIGTGKTTLSEHLLTKEMEAKFTEKLIKVYVVPEHDSVENFEEFLEIMYDPDQPEGKQQTARVLLELQVMFSHMTERKRILQEIDDDNIPSKFHKVVVMDRGMEDVLSFIIAASGTSPPLLHPLIAKPLSDLTVFLTSDFHDFEDSLGIEDKRIVNIFCGDIEEQLFRIEARGSRGTIESSRDYVESHNKSTAVVDKLFKEQVYIFDSCKLSVEEIGDELLELFGALK